MSISNIEPIASAASLDLTAADPHFTLPESAKCELDTLFSAMEAVALLTEAQDPNGPDLDLATLAPIYRSLSSLGKRLMGDAAIQFPTLRGRAAA